MPDNALTQPQDAFEELAGIALADHSMDTVMDKIAFLTKRTIPGATEVSVTLKDEQAAYTVACTGRLAVDLDERQYDKGYGPCLDCIAGAEPVLVDDMADEQRWPDWAAEAAQCGAGSSLSIPVPIQREVAAAVNIYGADAHAFDEHSIELGSTFAAYAGVALANMHLYQAQGRVAEQLQAAMQSRAVIEQAKGIIMGDRRCSADQAFDILVDLSQQSNRKLRDVAQALVARVEGTSHE
jgi:GAF domain-containing protein